MISEGRSYLIERLRSTSLSVPQPEYFSRKRDASVGSFSSGTDSGVESCEEVSRIPDFELASKIVSQVEMYFSDENLSKDAFLLKHVNRNREGYVNVKLVASLRRVKSICKDWKLVAASIKHFSQHLIVNDDSTKVRRTTPFNQEKVTSSQTSDSNRDKRTLVLMNLPAKKATVQDVTLILQNFASSMEAVEVVDGYHFESNGSQFNAGTSAIIVFKSEKEALQALKFVDGMSRLNWRDSMKGFIMASPPTLNLRRESESEPSRPALLRQRSKTFQEEPKTPCSFLRSKSGSCNSIDFLRSGPGVFVTRQPHGPNGSKGFLRKND